MLEDNLDVNIVSVQSGIHRVLGDRGKEPISLEETKFRSERTYLKLFVLSGSKLYESRGMKVV